MGQMFCQPSSIWCSKYVLLLFSFECPKPIRNYEKTNTWKIKRLVDDSFVSSAKQTSVSYSRLTDFFVYTLPTQFIKALLWLIVLCLVFKCAKISEFLKYFEILVITNSFWAETCPGEKTWIGFLEKWTLCKSTNAHRGTKSFLKIRVFQPLCF